MEPISDPETVASEAVVSTQKPEGYERALAEIMARRLQSLGRVEARDMLNRLFSAGSLPGLEAMLTFASRRQKVIAANIANVDTVGYRTRDLAEPDFRKALTQAFKPREGNAADAGSVKPGGNNVDLEIEMAKMVKNSALHSTVATLLANQFLLLREAVAGHVIS